MSLYRELFSTVVMILSVGCTRTVYEIELTPKGDQIERKLVVSRTGGKGGEEHLAREAARIALLYSDTFQPDQENKRGFVGTFQDRMPADVKGYGSYARLASSLGSASLYVERFRGDDDQAGRFERLQKAVNALMQLALGCCQQEFGNDPAFPKLRRFLKNDLARDLLNFSLYVSPIGAPTTVPDMEERVLGPAVELNGAEGGAAQSAKTSETSLNVRLAQYFLERNYFTIGELPRIVRTLESRDAEGTRALLAELIARKIGVPADYASLKLFADPERLKESWNKYLAATPEYQKLLSDFEKEQAQNPDAERPNPSAVLDQSPYKEIGEQLLQGLGLQGSSDELAVRLNLAGEPYASNGHWDETKRTLVWSKRTMAEHFPVICFAFWSQPDGKFQTDHFGRIILDKEDLAKYCLWYRGLTEREAAEWDKFVAELKPTEALAERLEAFRFGTGPSAEGEKAHGLPEMLRRMIQKNLEDPETARQR